VYGEIGGDEALITSSQMANSKALSAIGATLYVINMSLRPLLGALCCVAILACTGSKDAGGDAKTSTEPTGDSRRPGSDRDEHGCIGSAGYQWCERTTQCERPWELAEQEGFENSREAFKAWCSGR
jgi:hypothetical protein